MKPHMGTQQPHPTLPRDHSDTTQFHITQPLNTLDTIISTSSNTPFFHCRPDIAAPLSHTEPLVGTLCIRLSLCLVGPLMTNFYCHEIGNLPPKNCFIFV